METRQLSLRGCALKIGISAPALSDILHGSKPSAVTMQKIASAFHADLDRLYDLVGYKPNARRYPLVPEMESLIREIAELSEQEQAQAVRLITEMIRWVELTRASERKRSGIAGLEVTGEQSETTSQSGPPTGVASSS